MSGVLVVATAIDGALDEAALKAVGLAAPAAAEAGGLRVAVVGSDPEALAPAAKLAGVEEVIAVRDPGAQFEPHAFEGLLARLAEAEQPALLVMPQSPEALATAPALAAAAGYGLVTDATALAWEGAPIATRGAYGGKLSMEVEFPGRDTVVALVRPGSGEAPEAAEVPVRSFDPGELPAARTEHRGFAAAPVADVDITAADFVLAIGRGVDDESAVEEVSELAEGLGAVLAASRPLVDAGWLPASRQVGQSGRSVSPRVYLALGISGAVQHLAGIQSAETVIAVNTDPDAPIFQVADYGATVDLFDLIEELPGKFEAASAR